MIPLFRHLFLWFFLATFGVLVVAASAHTVHLSSQNLRLLHPAQQLVASSAQSVTYPSLGQVKGVTVAVAAGDARAALLENFLRRYKSPLQPHDEWGRKLVEIADRYCIDFRLLPAMAMQESNLCKNIPEGSYNCLGFGIHEKGTLAFDRYEDNFDRAGREIKRFYIDKGRLTPEDIMRKYTPHSDGSWADSVNQWMSEMKYNDRQLGREDDTNHNVLEFACPSPTPAQPIASPAVP